MRKILVLSFVMFLAACTEQQAKEDGDAVKAQVSEDAQYVAGETKANASQVGENIGKSAERMAGAMRDTVKRTNRKVRDWWLTPLPEEQENRAVEASYCYNVLQDILCYRQPISGWEHRLAGYQGTGAEPPAPAMMKPLPMLHAADPVKATANRIANTKPVFVALPPEEKKTETGEEPLAVDPANENLPDPALAPQL